MYNDRELPDDWYKNRACFICRTNIEDMRKAQAMPVGAGVTAVCHGDCATALLEQMREEPTRKAGEQYNQDKAELARLLATEAGRDIIRTQARALQEAVDIVYDR